MLWKSASSLLADPDVVNKINVYKSSTKIVLKTLENCIEQSTILFTISNNFILPPPTGVLEQIVSSETWRCIK